MLNKPCVFMHLIIFQLVRPLSCVCLKTKCLQSDAHRLWLMLQKFAERWTWTIIGWSKELSGVSAMALSACASFPWLSFFVNGEMEETNQYCHLTRGFVLFSVDRLFCLMLILLSDVLIDLGKVFIRTDLMSNSRLFA